MSSLLRDKVVGFPSQRFVRGRFQPLPFREHRTRSVASGRRERGFELEIMKRPNANARISLLNSQLKTCNMNS